ncbi:MAG: HAD family hydrolase [Acidobacteriota bacterium]|nr:HAD family hydrolase [Acidobacteriota bacterium]
MSGLKPAVFLDRDGTLNVDAGYLDRKERLILFPWSFEAVRLLRRAGYAVVVVTNQSGVARGMIEESFVEEVHRIIQSQLSAVGEELDGHYYCPHEPSASIEAFRVDCDCRKPKPGMVTRAARDLGLDVERSVVVGDKWSDIRLAKQTGARGVLVRTGYGRSQEKNPQEGLSADAVVDTLMDAVSWILRHPAIATQ